MGVQYLGGAVGIRNFLFPYEGEDAPRAQSRIHELVCNPLFSANIPGLHPKYTLSDIPTGCGGQVGIPAVQYREWFGPRDVSI